MVTPARKTSQRKRFSPIRIVDSGNSSTSIGLGSLVPTIDDVTTEERDFVRAVTGMSVPEDGPLTEYQQTWLFYVQEKILFYYARLDVPLPGAHNENGTLAPKESLQAETWTLLAKMCKYFVRRPGSSIDVVIDASWTSDPTIEYLHPQPQTQEDHRNKVRGFMFHILSAITMLYTSKLSPSLQQICIDEAQGPALEYTQPADKCERDLCELIQDYGLLMPIKPEKSPYTDDTPFSADKLYVAVMNARTLVQLGEVQIIWIDNISSHLELDTENRKLFVFRWPSFCKINDHNDGMLDKLLSLYYDEDYKPPGFTTAAYMKEIRQSYRLLFSDASPSRKYFNETEKKKLQSLGHHDPYLIELCGESDRSSNERTMYSKSKDFPILATRLSKIDDYITSQDPRSLTMMWRDRRNVGQWWTFWAVIVIGGIGLVLSMVQTGLAAAQVYYAIEGSE